jgi:hypothetical protein
MNQHVEMVSESTLQSELRLKYSRHWNDCARFANDRHFLTRKADATIAVHRLNPGHDDRQVKESRVSFAELFLRYDDRAPRFGNVDNKQPQQPIRLDLDTQSENNNAATTHIKNSSNNIDNDDNDNALMLDVSPPPPPRTAASTAGHSEQANDDESSSTSSSSSSSHSSNRNIVTKSTSLLPRKRTRSSRPTDHSSDDDDNDTTTAAATTNNNSKHSKHKSDAAGKQTPTVTPTRTRIAGKPEKPSSDSRVVVKPHSAASRLTRGSARKLRSSHSHSQASPQQ